MVIEERERVQFLRSRNATLFGTWIGAVRRPDMKRRVKKRKPGNGADTPNPGP